MLSNSVARGLASDKTDQAAIIELDAKELAALAPKKVYKPCFLEIFESQGLTLRDIVEELK